MVKKFLENKLIKGTIGIIILIWVAWWGVGKISWSWFSWPQCLTWDSSSSSVSGSIKELVTYLGDNVRGGRAYEAEKALVKKGGKSVDELIDTMLKGNGDVPRKAAWTLIQIGPPAIEPLRTELAGTQDIVAQKRIEFCLLHIREAIPQIKEEGYGHRKAVNSERMLKEIETGRIDSSPLPTKKVATKAKPAPKPVAPKVATPPATKVVPPAKPPVAQPSSVGTTRYTPPYTYPGSYKSVY